MAFRPTEVTYGYEDCRFDRNVDEEFHCSICYNVLKEPRMCRNNEHIFCLDCITEHLKVNSHTCPECKEHLSVETLRPAPRVLNNYLSKLKINCDYASRGCPEYVYVEALKTHVENCGFAPVLCSNEECGMEVNKQERIHHETAVCEYRKVKCHDCGQIQDDVGHLKESSIKRDDKMDDMKENLSKVTKDVDEVKAMMSQMLEKLKMLELLDKLPSPTEAILNTQREDILIASGAESSSKSTEIFSWEKNGWFKVSEMNVSHAGASSFIYNDQLFVVGGTDTKSIESLNLSELPLKWLKFAAELPYECDDHQTVVYQQRIIHIGGHDIGGVYNYIRGRTNVISEMQLTSPCTMEELCRMPDPRALHCAEIFEDKVLILGGSDGFNTLDSVLEFDVKKNEVKKMSPLPCALQSMATVRWRDKVVVLGGRSKRVKKVKCYKKGKGRHKKSSYHKKGKVLNNVYMYDCKTGQITALPPMLENRRGCCAVITGHTIVVMGGMNENGETLSSVECFTLGGSTWGYLPAMNEARFGATAQVLPFRRKYV